MVLVNFQVAEPPPVPTDAKSSTVKILEHTFGNSWGQPKIVQYTPPTDRGTPGSWAAVTLTLVVTSNGIQYDRLAVVTLQNTEIWRTSTAEPPGAEIEWTYSKDVTRYIPLFAKPGTFILELNNIVTDTLTGQYAATLYATFYEASQKHPTAGQSNLIVPISVPQGNPGDYKSAYASVPPPFSLNVTLPKNTVQIYAELYASGNANEEFWYLNTPGSQQHGPFREVRLLVDDEVAGVAFPCAVIFTGGINPSVWSPIVAYGAFDLPTYFLDLTPFAPTFADGQPHKITLDVVSAEENHAINDNWYVSGLLQVVTDPSGKQTAGKITRYDVQPYATTQTSAITDGFTLKAKHSVHIEADVVSGSGQTTSVIFQQNLEYTHTHHNTSDTEKAEQVSSGTVTSLHNKVPAVVDKFKYPLNITLSSKPDNKLYTTFDQSYDRAVLPAPFILGSAITEHQLAFGYRFSNDVESDNMFSYSDPKDNTYTREVKAVQHVITHDVQGGSLAPKSPALPAPTTVNTQKVIARMPGGKHLNVEN